MKTISIIKALLISASVCLLMACKSEAPSKKVGIIVPIEHKALNEIVAGFEASLRQHSQQPITFKVENAQGDMNLQRAMILQMKNGDYDLLVPIGLTASQMTTALVHNKPIVSLASTYTQAEREALKPCQLAVVHDEIPPQQIIEFVHQAYPDMKNIALIHSASEKIFPDVAQAMTAGKRLGIHIQPYMINTLSELYSVASSLPAQVEGILVLKDNVVVSGISTLVVTAEKRHIPLMTSDQGSVQEGASFALGVHEKEIGIQGGQLAAAILSGKTACSLPIVNMETLTVFINQAQMTKAKLDAAPIAKASEQLHYRTEMIK